MDIVTIAITLVLIVIVWKVFVGLLKFGAIALVIVAAIYFLTQGGMA